MEILSVFLDIGIIITDIALIAIIIRRWKE